MWTISRDKIPSSFVFSRCKLLGPRRQLQADLRKLMLPYTALKLKEKRRNNLKDFLNVWVTHFLMLSKTPTAPYLRVVKTPQGPTLTFKIQEYSVAVDIARSQKRPRCAADLFKDAPLVQMNKRNIKARKSRQVTITNNEKDCDTTGSKDTAPSSLSPTEVAPLNLSGK